MHFLAARERSFRGGVEGSGTAFAARLPRRDGPRLRETAAEADQPPEPAGRDPPGKGHHAAPNSVVMFVSA